jgi:hypothetical protein
VEAMSEITDRSVSQITVREDKPKTGLDLFEKKIYYEERDFYETRSKNLIGKKCLIKSSNNIEICDHAILHQRIIVRGDLAKVSIGKYVILSEMVILKPPTKRQNK